MQNGQVFADIRGSPREPGRFLQLRQSCGDLELGEAKERAGAVQRHVRPARRVEQVPRDREGPRGAAEAAALRSGEVLEAVLGWHETLRPAPPPNVWTLCLDRKLTVRSRDRSDHTKLRRMIFNPSPHFSEIFFDENFPQERHQNLFFETFIFR